MMGAGEKNVQMVPRQLVGDAHNQGGFLDAADIRLARLIGSCKAKVPVGVEVNELIFISNGSFLPDRRRRVGAGASCGSWINGHGRGNGCFMRRDGLAVIDIGKPQCHHRHGKPQNATSDV